MHKAMARDTPNPDVSRFAIHQAPPIDPVVGRLVDRELYAELKGSAYAVVDGIDGRTHHLRFDDIDMTGDAKPVALVELRPWDDARGQTIGRAHVGIPVTNAHLVCTLLLEKQ